jgi:hypothetical protein
MENLKLCEVVHKNTFTVLNREPDNFGFGANRSVNRDRFIITTSVDYGLIDKAGIFAGIKFGSQGDGFTRKNDVSGIGARRNQNQISILGRIDTSLNCWVVARNVNCGLSDMQFYPWCSTPSRKFALSRLVITMKYLQDRLSQRRMEILSLVDG